MQTWRAKGTGAFFALLMLSGANVGCRQANALSSETEIPTATVSEADIQLKVLATGALRAKESRVIAAPPIAGGTLQIVQLERFGARLKKGDVVVAFDPSQQEYNL